MANITLLDPTYEGEQVDKKLAPRFTDLNGKVMGILDITKKGSDIFLDRVEELICNQFEIADVVRVKKPTFARPAPTELLRNLAQSVDFVIEGLAD